MIDIAILSLLACVVAKMMTTKYRLSAPRLVRDDRAVRDSLIQAIGENNVNYYSGLATLYDRYRKKFSLSDLFFRPSSSRENAAVFYVIGISILAWWALTGVPTTIVAPAIFLLIIGHEYVSYWRDTYDRTMNTPEFQQESRALYDEFKPTHGMG